MPHQTKLEIRPVSAWLTQLLRVTAFYRHPQEFDISGWWEELTGGSPEKDTNQPKTATRTIEGPLGESTLVLGKTPIIVELRLLGSTESPKNIDGIPAVGGFEEECPVFLDLVRKLFKIQQFPNIRRLAFGAVLNLSVVEYEQAMRQLEPYMKNVTIDAANSRDFLYRINRIRPSTVGVSGLSINRVNVWSVVSYQSVLAGPGVGKPVSSKPQYACQLELDINTSQDFSDVLPTEKLGTIFEELVSMGTQIVAQGDVP